ncbi:MAG: hypothetical protein ABUL72_05450, partial [Armatimonadota bacterium]
LTLLLPAPQAHLKLQSHMSIGREGVLRPELAEQWGIKPILSDTVGRNSMNHLSDGNVLSPESEVWSLTAEDLFTIACSGLLLASNALSPIPTGHFLGWSLREFQS